jgi:hypothetical protein
MRESGLLVTGTKPLNCYFIVINGAAGFFTAKPKVEKDRAVRVGAGSV